MADTRDEKAAVASASRQTTSQGEGDRVKDECVVDPAAAGGRRAPSSESLNVVSVNSEEEGEEDEYGVDDDEEDDSASRISTHRSIGGENPVEPVSSFFEIPDEFYDRIPPHRKLIIVAVLSYCSFLAPISSTTVLSAIPEVAEEYNTTGAVVGVSNALYMLFMGISPIVWGPLSQVYGRRVINLTTSVLFFLCSIGTALSPNLAAFFTFRILTAFEGTAFILVGSACLSDIYRPTERATAMGWYLSGTLIGPALGPFIGGIIVTYRSWRSIFWLQSALSGLAVVLAFLLLPETIHTKKIDDLEGFPARHKAKVLWRLINPLGVMRLYAYPNLVAAGLASSALIWNMYSLLTPIRYVLNPRFGLTTPMQGSLFYLAPGAGYLVGTFFGGRYADRTVRAWMARREGGVRVPEDRLRSTLPFMGAVIPACMLIYGWGVETGAGGIPLAVITLFLQGVAQLFCFPSLNTYCLDVMPGRSAEVIAGNYFVRYLFACAGTAVVLPAVEAVGVGWFSTISAAFVLAGTGGVLASIWWGKGWREKVDRRRRARRKVEAERARERIGEAGGTGGGGEQVEEEEETKKKRKAKKGGKRSRGKTTDGTAEKKKEEV